VLTEAAGAIVDVSGSMDLQSYVASVFWDWLVFSNRWAYYQRGCRAYSIVDSDSCYSKKKLKDICLFIFFLFHKFEHVVFVTMQDSFTRCFKSNSPEPWNWNVYLFPLWCFGVVIRYGILFPLRYLSLEILNPFSNCLC
jgi:hypothetical protein